VSAPDAPSKLVWLKRTKARRKGAEHMKIAGCDLHTRYQQIAMLDRKTGELTERRLEHESGQAPAFYAGSRGGCESGSRPRGTRAKKLRADAGGDVPRLKLARAQSQALRLRSGLG
jgi:hypothetical protein